MDAVPFREVIWEAKEAGAESEVLMNFQLVEMLILVMMQNLVKAQEEVSEVPEVKRFLPLLFLLNAIERSLMTESLGRMVQMAC